MLLTVGEKHEPCVQGNKIIYKKYLIQGALKYFEKILNSHAIPPKIYYLKKKNKTTVLLMKFTVT